MDCDPGQLVNDVDAAYKTGDSERVGSTISQLIEFIMYAIDDRSPAVKMQANKALSTLRTLQRRAERQCIHSNDHREYTMAIKFVGVVVMLPHLKKVAPQAVKDAGLWDKGE
jgi:predicted RNA binding protein with dsRBD fold (UPF0201 family)